MVAATTTALEILDFFVISLDLVPKMQMLDLQFPSYAFGITKDQAPDSRKEEVQQDFHP
jgi:hypothetical protein